MTENTYSVGFIHYGSFQLTLDALRQLAGQSVLPASVCVVDNQGLGAEERARLEAAGAEVLSPGRNTGYAGGFNLLLAWFREGTADALWVLNSDVVLRKDAAEVFLRASAATPGWDVLGSYVTQDGKLWFGGGAYSRRTGRAAHLHYGGSIPPETSPPVVRAVDWINGCSIWVNRHGEGLRRDVDEHFFLYREELEWQVREPALRSFVVEAPLVDHEAGAGTGGTASGLGLTFLSRNAWIMASRASGVDGLVSRATWYLDFVLLAVKRRDLRALRTALLGRRLRSVDGPSVVKELVREGR